MVNLKAVRAGVAGLALLGGCASLHAQEAPAGDAVQEAGSDGDIVVTAMRRSQNLQSVSASITATSAEELEVRGIDDLRGLSKLVPNLRYGEHLGTTLITIRGVGSTVESGITEPTVALYVDGVYLPRSTMATLRAVDLERVEVLRGPQGTLYGRNATGGAINFISAAPAKNFEGSVNLSAGARDAYGLSGHVSIPISPLVSLRISGGREKQDGYVKVTNLGQRLNGTDVWYARGALRIEPANDVGIDLSARYERSSAPNAYQQLLTPTLLAAPDEQTVEPNRMIADRRHGMKVDTLVLAGTVRWDMSDRISVKSVTSVVDHVSNVISLDADGTGADFYSVEGFRRPSKSFGEEVSLAYESDRLDLVLGAFYYREKASIRLPLVIGAEGAPALGLPVGAVLSQQVTSRTESIAAYADARLRLSEQFRLTLGLRLSHETQDLRQTLDLQLAGVSVPGFPASQDASPKNDRLLPKINVEYDIADRVMAYFQWSRGYKAGGINLPGAGIYRPESIDSFEIGLKSELFDRSVTFNAAAFYNDYSDLQVNITVPPTSTEVNNTDAAIWGIEGELLWRPAEKTRLSIAATYLNAQFRDFVGFDSFDGQFHDLDGSRLPNAPKFTLNAGFEQGFDLTSDMKLTLRGDVAYTSDIVLRYFSGPGDIQRGYAIGNLSATLADERRGRRLTAFVNNVGDRTYRQAILYLAGGYLGNYGPPRTWGLRLSQDF